MSTRLPAGERRDQILEVAVQVFARRGYHGTSMNDVAEAAGVTKPVLYQHFDSKQALYLALIEDVGERMSTAIAKATAGAVNGKTQTELGFQAYFRWVADDHDAFLLLFATQANRDAAATRAIRKITDDAAAAIAPLIAVDIDPERQRTLAHGLVGLAEGVSRRLVERGDEFDPDELGRMIAGLAWAGLRSLSPKG
ncbi:MAG: TetR/AcrR family transcriptional regulator [Actinobacteria bacterium]|nr:TetR/AcrR family transcriptional regulator [Actinomycetota bacterium]